MVGARAVTKAANPSAVVSEVRKQGSPSSVKDSTIASSLFFPASSLLSTRVSTKMGSTTPYTRMVVGDTDFDHRFTREAHGCTLWRWNFGEQLLHGLDGRLLLGNGRKLRGGAHL